MQILSSRRRRARLAGNHQSPQLNGGSPPDPATQRGEGVDAKMAFLLMVEKLRLSDSSYIRFTCRRFEMAVAKPSYPSGENVRKRFRELYVEVLYFGTPSEVAIVEPVAGILGVPQPPASKWAFWPIWLYKFFGAAATGHDVLWKPVPRTVQDMVDWMRYAESAE